VLLAGRYTRLTRRESKIVSRAYIHGYSVTEQQRLIAQAAVLAPNLYAGLDLSRSRRLLELGCGAGAELAYLRSHHAGSRLVGVDISAGHLAAAHAHLAGVDPRREIPLVQADAVALPFPAASFDTVMTVWMLEHAARPLAVMAEALRVLTADGRLICTEVDNATLRVEPRLPAVDAWLAAFNRFQQEAGGDPYIGRRLTQMARRLGARDIASETLPILSSQREPHRRGQLVDYLESLLLSASAALAEAGRVRGRQIRELRADFDRLRREASIELRYFAVRMICRPPP
jgi:ubiquinone/menaquinone biosynthesis C-methylase UbiE